MKFRFCRFHFLKHKKYYLLITVKKYFTAAELQQIQEVNISFPVLNFIKNLSLKILSLIIVT